MTTRDHYDTHHQKLRLFPGPSKDSCRDCGSTRLTAIYEVRRVPVHCGVLMEDGEAARRFPCGDIRLVFCTECGYIGNALFNPDLQTYSPDYEGALHFSEHHSAFAKKLARRWVDDYDIRNKTILEIGCGDGEFLRLLCELGDNDGIGIDPACRPSRNPIAGDERVRLIRDEYSAKHGELRADVVYCRHTLEHIHRIDEFMRAVRQSLSGRPDALLLLELPNAAKTLRESAFWNIHYEHCSYFTGGSLTQLFRRNSFEIIDMWRDYDDQYLILAARPGSTIPAGFGLEDELQQTIVDVAFFQCGAPLRIRAWQAKLRELMDAGQKVVAWGTGAKCISFCSTLGIGNELSYAVDINPRRTGKYLPGSGLRIVEPEYLLEDPPDVILIMNHAYRDEIRTELGRLGVAADLLVL